MSDLDDLRRSLQSSGARADAVAFDIVDVLAEIWVDEAHRRVPVDTGQLFTRTKVTAVRKTGSGANATVEADTPYAGFVEYGTRFQHPQPYFRPGRDAAERAARSLGSKIETSLSRNLKSGGVWNPRRNAWF